VRWCTFSWEQTVIALVDIRTMVDVFLFYFETFIFFEFDLNIVRSHWGASYASVLAVDIKEPRMRVSLQLTLRSLVCECPCSSHWGASYASVLAVHIEEPRMRVCLQLTLRSLVCECACSWHRGVSYASVLEVHIEEPRMRVSFRFKQLPWNSTCARPFHPDTNK
jgi:hypothetical protein